MCGWSWPVELVFTHNDFGFLATATIPWEVVTPRRVGHLGSFCMKVGLTHDLRSSKHSTVLCK